MRKRSWLPRLYAGPPDEAAEIEGAESADSPPSKRVSETVSEPSLPGEATSEARYSRLWVRPRRARFFGVRQRINPLWAALASTIPFVVLLLLWMRLTAGAEPADRAVPPTILPSPAEVAASFHKLWFERALMRNALVSLGRVMAGFGVAAVIAVPLGIAMGSFSRVGAVFGLFSTVLSYIPIAAIVPLTIAWWGIEEKQKVGFLALATFAYLLPLVARHIRAVDHQYLLSAYAQGASAWQAVWRVLIPIALPDIANALRLCIGVGWTYIVLAEVVDAKAGLGNIIIVSQRQGPREHIYLCVVAIMVIAVVLDRSTAAICRALFPYARTTEED